MKTALCMLACLLTVWPAFSEEAESTLVKVGDAAPSFTVTTTEGSEVSTDKLKGKVILVNFFATWCGPCLSELPHLETEIWRKLKERGLAVVVIGREHNNEELATFKASKKFTFPIAADPKREVYGKYATQYIPRNFVVGRDGKVIYQSVGFDQAEFKQMIAKIEAELLKVE